MLFQVFTAAWQAGASGGTVLEMCLWQGGLGLTLAFDDIWISWRAKLA